MGDGREGAVAALVVVASFVVSGCAAGPFGEEPTEPLLAFAGPQSGFVTVGSPAEAASTRPLVAGVGLNLSADDDAGDLLVYGSTDAGRRFAVSADAWDASAPHRQGGVATDVELHGATGREGPSLPRVVASYAAWSSEAVVFVEDLIYPNPAGDGIHWDLEVLVLERGVHDVGADGRIPTADRGFYDPAQPREATGTHRGEVVVVLSSGVALNGSAALAPVVLPAGEDVPLTDPSYRAEHSFANPAWGATGVFEIEIASDAGSLAATDLTFSVVAPSGLVVNETRVVDVQDASVSVALRAPVDQLGVYSILVEGQAAAVRYRVTTTFESEGPLSIVLWWDDVSTGGDAHQRLKDWERLLAKQQQSNDGVSREPGHVVPNRVDSSQPPQLDLFLIGITVAATLLAGLVVVKLVVEHVKGRRFDERFGRK